MVTVKITEDARQMLRILAAHYGTKMHEEAASAAWHAIKRAGLEDEYNRSERRRARVKTNGNKAKERR